MPCQQLILESMDYTVLLKFSLKCHCISLSMSLHFIQCMYYNTLKYTLQVPCSPKLTLTWTATVVMFNINICSLCISFKYFTFPKLFALFTIFFSLSLVSEWNWAAPSTNFTHWSTIFPSCSFLFLYAVFIDHLSRKRSLPLWIFISLHTFLLQVRVSRNRKIISRQLPRNGQLILLIQLHISLFKIVNLYCKWSHPKVGEPIDK